MRAGNHDLHATWQRRLADMEQAMGDAMKAIDARQINLRNDSRTE